ncbi:MAG: hypothetical protein QF521_25700, partial [Alphaproteobacteria bacterium]|nr:hypothetical protein [Alphaproteobacteria bacterium]
SDPAESVTVQYNGSRGIDDAVDACYRMLLAVSFDPQQVAQSFIALGEGVYDVTCPGKKDPSST